MIITNTMQLYSSRIINILKELIDSIDYNIIVDEVIVLQNGDKKLFTKNTSYANTGLITKIGYQIKDFKLNEYIVIKTNDNILAESTIELNKPLFVHGTHKRVQLEVQKNNIIGSRPYIWLFELFQGKITKDPISNTDEEAKFRLYFISSTAPERDTYQNYEEVLDTLSNGVVNPFINAYQSNRCTFVDNYVFDYFNHEMFINNEKNVFGNNNSAIEIRFETKLIKNNYIYTKI